MKVLKKQHLLKTKAIENTIAERNILTKIRNPFIIDLYCTFQSQERVGFIMKFIYGGQLFFHLVRSPFLFSFLVSRTDTITIVVPLYFITWRNTTLTLSRRERNQCSRKKKFDFTLDN
eukprot:TRINITY_DN7561_c0_g2_i2.p1 TRINITY_DN7561_c0_g2~~TRINITY_DN7561_c0_g2_i2.p1  ORF type:complete len:118 (-),score=11.30 TRINITY_DN7561_c0_g2_i2:1166-1519(-)